MRLESRARRLLPLLLALGLLLATSACGGSDSGDGGRQSSSTTAGENDQDADETGDAGGDPAPTPGGEDDGGTDTGGGGNEAARFNLVASPDNAECSFVPNGHVSGADLLNVHFFFLIIGGNPPDVPAVRVAGNSDTGLSASYTSGPHNQAVSTAQFAPRGEDFGRNHTLTIAVDSANQVNETDETDNRIRVAVSLPSPRPSQTIDPLACSVSQG